MIRRSRARIVVLQVLVEDDMNPQRNMAQSDLFLEQRLRHFPETLEFAQSLLAGVRRERQELDRQMAETAQNWSLQRMAVTDRNAIRLGMYEILHAGTPGPVAINEAVELAKRFGAAHSGQFVNGILDRFVRTSPAAVAVAATSAISEDGESSDDVQPAEDAAPLRTGGPLKGFGLRKSRDSSKDVGPAERDK